MSYCHLDIFLRSLCVSNSIVLLFTFEPIETKSSEDINFVPAKFFYSIPKKKTT